MYGSYVGSVEEASENSDGVCLSYIFLGNEEIPVIKAGIVPQKGFPDSNHQSSHI